MPVVLGRLFSVGCSRFIYNKALAIHKELLKAKEVG
jgi:hypothetical protein